MTACPAFSASGIADSLRAVDCQAAETTADAFARLFGSHGALGPALTVLLTLYIAFLAFGLLTGRSALSLSMLTPRMMALGLALTFATSWVAYQSVLWNLLAGAPDQIAGIILGTKGSATMLFADRLDALFRTVSSAAESLQATQAAQPNHNAGTFNPADLLGVAALMLLLGTVGVLIVARIALAAMLAIGPIFILLSLFRATRGLFEGWLKASVLFALLPLMTVLIGGGALEMMEPAIAPLAMGGEISVETAVGVFLAASVYLALLAMAVKAAGTLISGWRSAGGRQEEKTRSSAPATPASRLVAGEMTPAFRQDRARLAMARLTLSTSNSAVPYALSAAAGGSCPTLLPAAAPLSSRQAAAKTDVRLRAVAAIGRAIPVLLLLFAVAGQAEEGRNRTVAFDEARVVTLSGKVGFQSTIQFGAEEHIENVAVGDSAAWQVTPNRRANLLFVKAMTEQSRSNMTVVTDQHTYMFDLVAGNATAITYVLRFDYPSAAVPAEPVHQAGFKPQRISANLPVRETTPEPVTSWKGKGADALKPRRAFDDGRAVYLSWDKGVALPAILVPGPDETEGAVNYTVKGGYVVIDGLPDRIVLRRGESSVVLTRGEEE